MTINQFKKIARTLKEAYKVLEEQAVSEGISVLSSEYTELQNKVRLSVLEEMGYTLEEYREAKEKATGTTGEVARQISEDTESKMAFLESEMQRLRKERTFDEKEVRKIAEEIAKKYIVPPQITNKIIKETIVEKPIKETVIEREEYDPTPLMTELSYLDNKVKKIKVPTEKELKELIVKESGASFAHNIDLLGMPKFRKLAMGLQAQIDAIDTSGGGGTWGSITGTLSNQTDLQTALDNKQDTLVADTDYLTPGTAATTYQPLDSDLTTIAGLTATTNNFIVSVSSAWASRTPAQVRTTLNVEDGADVTDTANVTAAGALMDSEVTNLAQVKAFSSADYAPALGVDDNYVTDAEKVVIGNTSGTNTGDQTLPTRDSLGVDTDDTVTFAGVLLSGLTASQLLATDASKNLVSLAVATYPSLTELTYVKGVTSAIQTQIDGKIDGTMVSNRVPYGSDSNTLQTSANLTFDGSAFAMQGSAVFNESGADVDFRIEGSGQANALFVQGSDGFIGIGTNTPTSILDIQSDVNAGINVTRFGSAGITVRALGVLYRARGTQALPEAVIDTDYLGSYLFGGYDGANYQAGGEIRGQVDGAVSAGVVPASFGFYTGSAVGNRTLRFNITSSGNIAVGNLTPSTNLHLQESNTDTTPALEIEQLSTGDAGLQFSIVGDSYAMGIDNTTDALTISYASTAGTAVLGTNDLLTIAPSTGNAVFTGTVTVPDDAYDSGWNGDLSVPTKNAVYDKIETLAPVGYALVWYAGSSAGGSASPSDSTTYYLRTQGIPGIGATASTSFTRVIVPKSGTIKAVYGQIEVLGTLSSGEDSTVAVRINDTTSTNVSTTVETSAIYNDFGNGSMSVAVTAGDFIDVLLTTPAWATNPTTVRMNVSVYIE